MTVLICQTKNNILKVICQQFKSLTLEFIPMDSNKVIS